MEMHAYEYLHLSHNTKELEVDRHEIEEYCSTCAEQENLIERNVILKILPDIRGVELIGDNKVELDLLYENRKYLLKISSDFYRYIQGLMTESRI